MFQFKDEGCLKLMETVHILKVSTAVFYKNVAARVERGIYPTKGSKSRKSET